MDAVASEWHDPQFGYPKDHQALATRALLYRGRERYPLVDPEVRRAGWIAEENVAIQNLLATVPTVSH